MENELMLQMTNAVEKTMKGGVDLSRKVFRRGEHCCVSKFHYTTSHGIIDELLLDGKYRVFLPDCVSTIVIDPIYLKKLPKQIR